MFLLSSCEANETPTIFTAHCRLSTDPHRSLQLIRVLPSYRTIPPVVSFYQNAWLPHKASSRILWTKTCKTDVWCAGVRQNAHDFWLVFHWLKMASNRLEMSHITHFASGGHIKACWDILETLRNNHVPKRIEFVRPKRKFRTHTTGSRPSPTQHTRRSTAWNSGPLCLIA